MKLPLLLIVRQYRQNPLRSALLFGSMLCAVCLICGTMFGIESLNSSVIISADSTAGPLIHRAAQLVTLLVAFFAGLLLKNNFLITLEQRMHMLGRLYALGISHRMMQRMVRLETLLGIGGAFLCGAPLSALVLWCIFQKLNTSPAILERFGSIKICVQPDGLLFCALCCFVAALIATYKPLQIVKSVTPITLLQNDVATSMERSHGARRSWRWGKNFVLQYAQRNFQKRRKIFLPLYTGLAACVLLVVVCHAFTSGMKSLYNQQAATYAYRVYLQSENNSVSETFLKELAVIFPETDALMVEEMNISTNEGFFRLLILEDADFAAWYEQDLTAQLGEIPYVRANAISNGPSDSPVITGAVLTQTGCSDKTLPLNIGRIPEEKNVTVGVTERTAFTNAVVTPAQNRSLIVYYDTTDDRTLTPRLSAVLETAGCHYTIQDYTSTSEWAQQRQAIGLLIQTIRICFPLGVLLLGGLEIFTVMYAQILAQRREFALLHSTGVRRTELYEIAFSECGLCLLRGLLWGTIGGVVLLVVVAKILQQPWLELLSISVLLLCVACFGISSALAVLFAMRTILRSTVSNELREE